MVTKTITLSYDSENEQRIINAIKGRYSVPLINVGKPGESIFENEFTDIQWAKEAIRRLIVKIVHDYENEVARINAQVEADDEIIL